MADEKSRMNVYIDADLYALFADLAPRRHMSTVVEHLLRQWCRRELQRSDPSPRMLQQARRAGMA